MERNEMEKRLIFQTEGYGKSDITYELRMCLPYIPDLVKRKTAAEAGQIRRGEMEGARHHGPGTLRPGSKAHGCMVFRYGKESLDEAVELMFEVVLSKRPYIRIAGDDFSREVVKGRFLKINFGHLEYVLDCIDRNTTKAGNIKAYLLAALYNARQQWTAITAPGSTMTCTAVRRLPASFFIAERRRGTMKRISVPVSCLA